MTRNVLAMAVLFLATSSMARAQAPGAAGTPRGPAAQAAPDNVEGLLKAFRGGDQRAFYQAAMKLETQFDQGPDAEAAARRLLEQKSDVVTEPAVRKRLDELAERKTPVQAARWLLAIAKARQTVHNYRKGHVVVGRLIVEDGRADPELVMAQMPILPDGYFAGEVGDLVRPIAFRSHGYQNLDVPLEGKTGDVVDVGTVILKPLPKDEQASLKGTVHLDDPGKAGTATARLSVSVGPINTPHNGYSPRRRWPQAIELPISKDGVFTAKGLSPTGYYLSVMANSHVASGSTVHLKPGQELDAGPIRLRCEDLGFYIGKPAPKAAELAWEKDFPTALEKARSTRKPLMVMMTATWCGPCKHLESQTLSDPWIRHFLSGFVVVKAYEDKNVEETYGLRGYPTLVFTDSDGRAAYTTVGYKPTLAFAGECAQAYRKLSLELPAELKALVDRKVLSARN